MHDKRSEESTLEQSYQTLQPMDPDTARTVLVEVKKILDHLDRPFRHPYLTILESKSI